MAKQDQAKTEGAVPGSFLALVERRRSVRAYSGKAVAHDKIERCLEAARLAPSACNAQPWTWVVVDQPDLRAELASAAGGGLLPLNHFVHQAPVLMVLVAEKASASARFGAAVKRKTFVSMDVAIAAEHFCLQAAEEGLGTCMLGWFDESRVRFLLGIPAGSRPMLLLTLGYSAENNIRARRRRPLPDIHDWNRYPGSSARGARPISGWRSWAGFLCWIGITFAAAGAGGVASGQAGGFYRRLEQPGWAPPGWVFGPVWGILYPLLWPYLGWVLFATGLAWTLWRMNPDVL